MNGLPSFGGGHGALHHLGIPAVPSEFLAPAAASTGANKHKRRPAGTPDPGAEVVVLSPKTLMESDRYVCEICNQGFQRDQNLQMHRRRHKVPWKLLKKPSVGIHKRVYVCPERTCLHHNPAHALGDLVGIKKHYRRKHCTEKQWKCDRCSKRYAVQSDFKAHLKTCGTRGHCCDCGRVFSRVESFIEHQDTCNATKQTSMQQSEGAASERNLLVCQDVTDRNSNDSPSQSSDTTQAMSFSQSGMSERSADSTKVPAADDGHQYSGRILAAQQALTTSANYNYVAAMPAWLMDRRSNELELLQPAANIAIVTHDSSLRTQVSSINSAAPEDVNTPSLQLSIGSLVDTKPSLSSVQRKALALQSLQQGISSEYISRPRSGDVVALEFSRTKLKISRPHLGNDLVLSIRSPVNSVTDSLEQAAARRAGPDSSKAVQLMFAPSKKQSLSRNAEIVVNCNPNSAGSYSSFHEDREGNIHHSGSSDMGFTMRGPKAHEARLDPTTPSRSSLDLMDVNTTAPLFFASPSIWGSEANNGLASARRTRVDQARQASDEAQRELAHADRLRREAYKQLQLASAERADAETELAKAQRQRKHAQAERQMAPLDLFRDQGFSFCHSCKSAIQTRLPKFGSS